MEGDFSWKSIKKTVFNEYVLLVPIVSLVALDRFFGRREMTMAECKGWIPKCEYWVDLLLETLCLPLTLFALMGGLFAFIRGFSAWNGYRKKIGFGSSIVANLLAVLLAAPMIFLCLRLYYDLHTKEGIHRFSHCQEDCASGGISAGFLSGMF